MDIDAPAQVIVKDQNGNERPCRITRVDADAEGIFLIEVTLSAEPAEYAPGYVTPKGLPEATFIGSTPNGTKFRVKTGNDFTHAPRKRK